MAGRFQVLYAGMGTTAGRLNHQEFAKWWVRAWSNRDVDAVADRFAEHVRFVSPRAAEVTGEPVVVGREALRSYWHHAVAGAESIEFKLDRILEDEDGKRIVIVYISDIDGRRKRACEFMQFDEKGEIVAAEAMHGCLLP
jgi:ketosteroid isomerase-like protein